MTAVTLSHPWLEFDLGAPMQVLSWAVHRPGPVTARRILWRQVRDADLPQTRDARAWLAGELDARKAADAVAFLTSCDISAFTQATVTAGNCTAHAVVTVGLSNAERVGQRARPARRAWGTINIAARISTGLTQFALIEAVSIAVQARTAAMLDAALPLDGGLATGTGTDCIAVAAQTGPADYAGLHTDVGEALGAAVYSATRDGAQRWMRTHQPSPAMAHATTGGIDHAL